MKKNTPSSAPGRTIQKKTNISIMKKKLIDISDVPLLSQTPPATNKQWVKSA